MAQLVAFLRAINLGSRHRVPMAELRDLLDELGYPGARTLLQSGNVVLETTDQSAKVARALERGIEQRFGFKSDVIVRTHRQVSAIVKADPLGDVATDGSKRHVVFLADKPKAAVLKEIAAEDFSPEAWEARGREIFMWCPNGSQGSRVSKALGEKRLGVTATVRNWNTLAKLHDML